MPTVTRSQRKKEGKRKFVDRERQITMYLEKTPRETPFPVKKPRTSRLKRKIIDDKHVPSASKKERQSAQGKDHLKNTTMVELKKSRRKEKFKSSGWDNKLKEKKDFGRVGENMSHAKVKQGMEPLTNLKENGQIHPKINSERRSSSLIEKEPDLHIVDDPNREEKKLQDVNSVLSDKRNLLSERDTSSKQHVEHIVERTSGCGLEKTVVREIDEKNCGRELLIPVCSDDADFERVKNDCMSNVQMSRSFDNDYQQLVEDTKQLRDKFEAAQKHTEEHVKANDGFVKGLKKLLLKERNESAELEKELKCKIMEMNKIQETLQREIHILRNKEEELIEEQRKLKCQRDSLQSSSGKEPSITDISEQDSLANMFSLLTGIETISHSVDKSNTAHYHCKFLSGNIIKGLEFQLSVDKDYDEVHYQPCQKLSEDVLLHTDIPEYLGNEIYFRCAQAPRFFLRLLRSVHETEK